VRRDLFESEARNESTDGKRSEGAREPERMTSIKRNSKVAFAKHGKMENRGLKQTKVTSKHAKRDG